MTPEGGVPPRRSALCRHVDVFFILVQMQSVLFMVCKVVSRCMKQMPKNKWFKSTKTLWKRAASFSVVVLQSQC